MIARVLPREEWYRLEGRAVSALLPLLSPDEVRIVVVEKDGEIVGCCGVFTMTMLEGVEIDEEHRNPGVGRSLLAATLGVAEDRAARSMWAGAASEEMAEMVERLGGLRCTPLEFHQRYVIPIPEKGH